MSASVERMPAGRGLQDRWRPAGPIRARFQRWLRSRVPLTDTLQLTQGNIYILPTRAGLMFCLTLLVLLLASINYQLNLGYVLTFLLAGSGAVSMHLTHGTLRGLTLHLKPPAAVFAGDAAALDIVLTSPGRARYGIGVKVASAADTSLVWIDVPALGQAPAQIRFVPLRRGGHDAPTIGVETCFPLGLFRAWAIWRPAARLLAYPTPERPSAALPPARPLPGGVSPAHAADGGEVEGVRPYRRGDPMKQVAWKKAAKALETGGELVSRDTRTSLQQELWLDWQACPAMPAEDRLSRLTAWVVAAHRAGVEFGLRLPGIELAPASGDMQRRRCLEELALWR